MKKILSLFISALIILTMTFSMTSTASTPLQIRPATVCLDTKNSTSRSLDYDEGNYKFMVDNIYAAQIRSSSSRTVLDSFTGFTNVLRIGRKGTTYPWVNFYVRDASNTSIVPSDGIVEYNAKIYTTDDLNADKRHFRIYPKRGSSYAVAQKLYEDTDAYKWLPNTWYDVKWTINMNKTSKNVVLTMVPELSAASSSEISTRTISHTYSYAEADINYLRIDLGTVTASGNYIYYADLKVNYYPNTTYNKAEILSVGSAGEVAFEQNNISVKLSDDIPEFEMKHITIKNSGNQDVAISSAAVTSDGTYYYINLTTENPLPAWTQYTLTISADAWGKYSLQTDGVTDTAVTPISEDFYTPSAPFDMKDPVFGIESGILTVDTALINTTGTPEDITILIVTYDNEDRLKSMDAVSYEKFEAAYPGADKHIEVPISEGDTTKVIAIHGWNKMTALFGKYWEVSYSELN